MACLIWLGFIEGAPLLRSMTDLFGLHLHLPLSLTTFIGIGMGSTFYVLLVSLSSVLNHRFGFVSGSVFGVCV